MHVVKKTHSMRERERGLYFHYLSSKEEGIKLDGRVVTASSTIKHFIIPEGVFFFGGYVATVNSRQ